MSGAWVRGCGSSRVRARARTSALVGGYGRLCSSVLVLVCSTGCGAGDGTAIAGPPDASAARPADVRDAGAENVVDSGKNQQGVSQFVDEMTTHMQDRYVADLDEIKRRGVLRVVTRNNSTSYFLYRGVEAGFNYELAKLLADELGVRLELVVPPASRDLVPWVLDGRGDIIIGSLATDAPRTTRVRLTRPYLHTSLVVITRKGRLPPITRVDDLTLATLWVRPSSSATKRLRTLARETRLGLHIKAARETLETEDLIDLVATGEADCAVVERRIADVELMHRDDVEISLELPTEPVTAAFAVHPDNQKLWAAADDFLRRHYRGTVFNILYRRYHKNARRAAAVRDDELRADKSGRLTPWDVTFQAVAKELGVDWRLLASQAYQESRLNPLAVSPFGAQGLMQIMPATARELGIKDPFDPVESIEGAGRYVRELMRRYDAEGVALKDRVRFALAAYNVGAGHIADARKLAEQQGWNPNRWFGHVERALRLLSKPRYFRGAKYGYCRGEEPVRYVSEIQSRYDAYVRLGQR